ncbi:MAG: DNA helicase [Leptospiraceae bacterium]|nr:MAG: DNA helicase [Leptospiraceae bacterium]
MDKFKELLKKEFIEQLNLPQQEAVLHFKGPMLIFAGAGSGKTRVITHRIAYMIRILDVNPESIVAVTFTNKAAEEMRERVLNLIGPYGEKVTIKTFHSLGLQILRENYKLLNVHSNFSIYDSSSQKSLAKKIFKFLKMDTSNFSINDALQKIHLARDEFLDPEEFYTKYENHYQIYFLYEFYKKYIEELRINNAFDFGDLLYESVKLLTENPEILEYYQTRWQFLMIDEYQDTNYVQYLLAMLISKNHKNIVVVGDDDQSIYSWRGAKIENILNFKNDFPEAKIIKLEENYRSTNQILNLANKLIKNNSNRSDKKLYSKLGDGEKPILYECFDEYDEARKILSEIHILRETFPLDEIAIFYRTNAQSRVFEQLLRENNIPYILYGGIRFFERKEIKDILSYLHFINNPFDYENFERMVENPPKGIGQKTLEKIRELAQLKNINYIEAINEIIIQKNIRSIKNLEKLYDLIIKWKQFVDNLSLGDLIQLIVEESGIIAHYEKDLNPENQSRIENIKEFIQSVIEYEQQKIQQNKPVILSEYLQEISLLTSEENPDQIENKKGIQLMTLHNAKGLEFSVVFLTGLEEGILPHQLSMEENNIEEERRLLYVGITRAKRKLYLSYAKIRNRFGQQEFKVPSRFLLEMELLNSENIKMNNDSIKKDSLKNNTRQKATIREEDLIINETYFHDKFGAGILKDIEDVAGRKIITIEFFNGQIKRFLAKSTPLRKISNR